MKKNVDTIKGRNLEDSVAYDMNHSFNFEVENSSNVVLDLNERMKYIDCIHDGVFANHQCISNKFDETFEHIKEEQ